MNIKNCKSICFNCKKEILVFRGSLKNKRNFCSKECEDNWRSIYWKELQKIKSFGFKKNHKLNLGNKFARNNHPKTEWKINRVPWNKGMEFNQIKGKNNGNCQGGTSLEEYGSEFDSSLKEQVRQRDGYKCQLCGCSQVENGKQLDVHHIDYNKKNNNINNLISLCHSCHMKTGGNRHKWFNYFKEKARC